MNKKILVVDDEPLVLDAIGRALSKEGYEVMTVQDGNSCLEALSFSEFGLIIMDLHIPGISTGALAGAARARCPETKFLFISGGQAPDEATPYIQKPFRISDIRKLVGSILGDTAHN
ncbi:MAG: response regulator [Nitrospiraceae bacterium]|nr:response regulator [Nitrospiraceae bacterium]